MVVCPKKYTIVSGTGISEYSLVSFDNALRNAGIGDFNLVKVSSILPAGCVYQESVLAEKGSIIYVAYATITVNEGDFGNTSVAVAIPSSDKQCGVIFEFSSNKIPDNIDKITRNMCCEAMENRKRDAVKSQRIT